MIQIIAGKKGSGKTKRIIDMTNKLARDPEKVKDVVFVDKDDSYLREISHKARFVNAMEYEIDTPKMFLGFLCGMLSSNYDIGTIFVDAFLKLCKTDMAEAEWFFASLEKLCAKHDVDFVLSVSAEPAELPAYMQNYII